MAKNADREAETKEIGGRKLICNTADNKALSQSAENGKEMKEVLGAVKAKPQTRTWSMYD